MVGLFDIRKYSTIHILLILSFFPFINLISEATVMKKFEVAELASGSNAIAVARITEIKTAVVGGIPWTYVTATVEKQLKGNIGSQIQFRVPGGTHQVNGRTLVTRVEGVPTFHTLEKGVFFLEGEAPAIAGLLGWSQGYWRVEVSNGQEVVISSGEIGSPAPIPFQQFLREVQFNLKEKSK